jgi:hypothetical protein
MELLASLFVGKPLDILTVAVLFLAAHVALHSTIRAGGRPTHMNHRVVSRQIYTQPSPTGPER